MKYAIQNDAGAWWTGQYFGLAQAREGYDFDELPQEIEGAQLEIWQRDPLYAGYYDQEANEATSLVREIREEVTI